MFLSPATDAPLTCCSASQVRSFDTSMALPKQLLSRCPGCYTNFVNLYCDFTCGPHQSLFMSANSTGVSPKGKPNILSVNYLLSNYFADGMYESCKDVQMPSNNQKAIGVLCGKDASQCTPQNWLDFMGNHEYHNTPFQINFNLSDVPVTFPNGTLNPMNDSIVPCNESCSCQDCRASCGSPPPAPPPATHWEILGVDAFSFIFFCIFANFGIIFGSYLAWYWLYCHKDLGLEEASDEGFSINNHPRSEGSSVPLVMKKDIKCWERLSESFERLLGRGFSAWGRMCAGSPVIVLVVGFLMCLALSCGLVLFQVTTDPVELWSAPNSRARLEKNYFEEHFT